MAGLVQFPLSGTVLSPRVNLDRISLVQNTVGNAEFPIGQYVFFTKNNTIWYRYKIPLGNWSLDQQWIVNGRESNTKFDANGYPFTAYISNVDNSLNIIYFVNGIMTKQGISPHGRFPTVLIEPRDTFVFWVPNPYTTYLPYLQGCDGFTLPRQYVFTPPSTISMLNIEYLPNSGQWVWTFTYSGNPSNQIYVGFSVPVY